LRGAAGVGAGVHRDRAAVLPGWARADPALLLPPDGEIESHFFLSFFFFSLWLFVFSLLLLCPSHRPFLVFSSFTNKRKKNTKQKIYRASYVELQRNDAVSRSPVFAHFSESLSGVDTIRAFGRAGSFQERFELLVDRNHAAFFSLRSADQWLSLRLELCGSGIVLLAAVLSLAARRRIPASLAALSLTEALDVTGFLKYLVMSVAMLEARMNAVERLRAYSLLAPEAARETAADRRPADDWPTRGDLSFRDVWLRYRAGLEPALRGVSFSLEAGAKAGVVGRTGSGKR
jgi:ABC-type multidrug transport system fused ATPase/permease subunit